MVVDMTSAQLATFAVLVAYKLSMIGVFVSRWQQETEAPAATDGTGAVFRDRRQAAGSPAGSPDGAAPMQQDDVDSPAPQNPFGRCASRPCS